MNAVRNRLFYILYTVGITAVFLYILFPADAVRDWTIRRFALAQPGYTLSIDRTSLALPPGLDFRTAGISRNEKLLLELDKLRLIPGILSLTGSEPSISFDGAACGGSFDGQAIFSKTGTRLIPAKLTADIAGIQIDRIAAIRDALPFQTSGRVNAVMSWQQDKAAVSGEANIKIADAAAEAETSLSQFVTLKKLSFSDIQAQIRLETGQRLRIESCTFRGEQVSGSFTGTVSLRQPMSRSTLEIEGTISPHPALIAGMGQIAATLFKNKSGQGIPVRITGTLEKPGFSLK